MILYVYECRLNEESGYQIPSFSSSFAWTGLSMSSSNLRNTNSQNTLFEKRHSNSNMSTMIGHHGAGIHLYVFKCTFLHTIICIYVFILMCIHICLYVETVKIHFFENWISFQFFVRA